MNSTLADRQKAIKPLQTSSEARNSHSWQRMLTSLRMLRFEDLQSKTFTEKANDGKIYNGIIKEVNGEKIGVFGLTTEETKAISSPDKVTFTNYITEAKAAVSAFEEAGVNKIIALTHIGFNDSDKVDNDILLATKCSGHRYYRRWAYTCET